MPGSSRTLLEARDPYAPRALAELLGAPPAQAVSPATAQAMASWARKRAAALAASDWPLLGLACTAAITTDRARRGADRACIAIADPAGLRSFELVMAKNRRSRADEETLASRLVLLALARACGTPEPTLALLDEERLVEL